MRIRTFAKAILSCFFWATLMFAFLVFTNALYWLLNLVIHFLSYFASHAVGSSSDNFANSCVSPISVAVFRIVESWLRYLMRWRKWLLTYFVLLSITSDGVLSSQGPVKSQEKHLEYPSGLWAENDVQVNFTGLATSVPL